jgi:hypothetical protein
VNVAYSSFVHDAEVEIPAKREPQRLGFHMRTSVRFVGAAGLAAGLVLAGSPAFADSADNDGVNIGNDNNIVIAPIQLCDASLLGGAVNLLIGSPQNNNCVNAPLVDHPSAQSR